MFRKCHPGPGRAVWLCVTREVSKIRHSQANIRMTHIELISTHSECRSKLIENRQKYMHYDCLDPSTSISSFRQALADPKNVLSLPYSREKEIGGSGWQTGSQLPVLNNKLNRQQIHVNKMSTEQVNRHMKLYGDQTFDFVMDGDSVEISIYSWADLYTTHTKSINSIVAKCKKCIDSITMNRYSLNIPINQSCYWVHTNRLKQVKRMTQMIQSNQSIHSIYAPFWKIYFVDLFLENARFRWCFF